MCKLKHLAISMIALFCFNLTCLGSVTDVPASEGRLRDGLYEYHVPFAESNFVGAWKFRLEIAAADGTDFNASVKGYNIFGSEVELTQGQDYQSGVVFAWDSGNGKFLVLQSLFISADKPLTGVLWMWDENSGVMNGVSIQNQLSTTLVMPHIPNDFFRWRTYFSVTGVSDLGQNGDIIFGYYDEKGAYEEIDYWSSLGNNAYLTAIPYLDIPIGGLSDRRAQWGRVRSSFNDYQLAGYQSFKTLGRSNTSCAIELMGDGESEGWVGFSRLGERKFSSFFSFSNPFNEVVVLSFSLRYEVDVEVENPDGSVRTVTEIETKTLQQELAPFERRLLSPEGLFGEVSRLVSFHYAASTPELLDEENNPYTEPRDIYALHMQFGADGEMGGHHFVAEPGNRSTAWLNLGDTFESVIELFNTSDAVHPIRVTLVDETGHEILNFDREMAPFGSFHNITSTLRKNLLVLDSNFDLSRPVRVYIRSQIPDVRFISKLTAVQDRDVAVVNPLMVVGSFEEPPADEGEPQE